MRSSIVVNKTGRGLRCLALVLLAALVSGTAAAPAKDITVSGSPKVGVLPQIITAFVIQSGTDVLPAGSTDYYAFTLFDTGSTRIYFDANTAASLGVTNGLVTDIRINGIGAIDPATLDAPIYPGQAQAEVLAIPVSLPASPPNRTLIGGPVTNVVKAVIDYTTTVTRGPYAYLGGANVEGPDITFYPAGSPVGFTPAITLGLQAFGNNPTNDPGLGKRYFMYSVSFNEGSASVATPASGDLNVSGTRFLYDTGTTVTMVTASLATALGLTGTPDFTQNMSDGSVLNGYYLDSITMTGVGGVYTVLDAPVVVASSLGGVDARIGSNLFSQTKLLFDGPAATLGISVPTANNPPVANAGADQVIEATGPTTPFPLDGTLSSDPDGDTITYSWKDANGNVVGEGATVTLSRALGAYVFTLTVADPGGLTAEAAVSITIRDTTPPALTAPPDITVAESDPLGTAVNLGQATVSDICDPAPSVTNNAPASFALGVTTVTWTATDASGNVLSVQQKVAVVPGTPVNQLTNLAKLINYSVASGGIASEMQRSLLAKTNAAIATLVRGNPFARITAMLELEALVLQVRAQTGRKITPAVAAVLISRAHLIIATLWEAAWTEWRR
jgi:hypothetical protein